jgi:fructosamine-3-kinase
MTAIDTPVRPGPVDYLVIEFPPDRQEFTGELSEQLQILAQSGTIRLLRVLIAIKDDNGDVVLQEYDSRSEAGPVLDMAADVASLMADDALAGITRDMATGTVVGVVIWENTWAAGFIAAAVRAGGRRVDSGRIPASALAPEADDPAI